MTVQHDSQLEYELVVSKRARRASLRVVPGRGLIVSIPRRFPKRDVKSFVDSQRAWINESLADLEARTLPQYRQWPPRHLPLRAMDTCLSLSYADDPECAHHSDAPVNSQQLHIHAAPGDRVAVANAVAVHLKKLARAFLPPLLASQAHLHNLSYKRVSVRGQRTLWGSYSSSGTLSLNYKLLFLRRELVDYVLLHELAHTVHLDHSEQFWQLLCRLNVNSRLLDKQLAKAGPQVPPWLELAR